MFKLTHSSYSLLPRETFESDYRFGNVLARVNRADSLHSSSKNGVAQMFIIADLRKGEKSKAVILLSAPETVCINLNGNCGAISRHARLSTLASPSFLFYFLNKSPLLTVCYPARALPISRDFRHLFPFRGVLDGVLTSTPSSIRLVREVGNLEFQNASSFFFFSNYRATVPSVELSKFSSRVVHRFIMLETQFYT